MHIAEGILPVRHAAATWTLAAPAIAWSLRWAKCKDPDQRRHRLTLASMSTALVFATTLLPIPVPVAGVTSHLCATPLLALVMGPRAIIFPTFLSLAVQALFLGHGGITTLGANLLTLGVVGPVLAWAIARTLRRLRMPAAPAVFIACAIGELAVYVADAAVLGLALSTSTPFLRVFTMVLVGFAPVQIPLATLEGTVSAFTLGYLAKRQAHLVPGWLRVMRTALPLVLLAALATGQSACGPSPRGADEAVLDHVAAQAGRPPTPWFAAGDERVLAFGCAGSFVAGVIVTRLWNRLRRDDPDGGPGKQGGV
jgi:cobalt/nickel transport system permease protein